MNPGRLRLGVNIDHVATIRNARGGRHPDPVRAARLAAQAGPTASPPISGKIAGTSPITTSNVSAARSISRSIWRWPRPRRC